MVPVSKVSGKMAPLDRADVDTDQIIPKQFLKRIERTGYGAGLFEAWKRDPAFALNDPRYAGAAILIAQNPGAFDANPKLPLDSARYLASGGYYVDAAGKVGSQTLEQWTGYSKFLFDQGLLAGPDGKPLASAPDYASLFTNEFLP